MRGAFYKSKRVRGCRVDGGEEVFLIGMLCWVVKKIILMRSCVVNQQTSVGQCVDCKFIKRF